MRTTVEPPGNNCPAGGNKIQFGTDTNGNNILDDSEINPELTKYVCNGSTGLNSVMRTVPELAGANCATGGTRIQGGTDTNGNNILDDSEINAALTQFVCNGTQNPAGNSVGDMQYWNGSSWTTIPAGTTG